MNESDSIRLRHMLEAAAEALRIAGGRPRNELLQDRIATLAVIKDLEITGEAASKVSVKLRTQEPNIPWIDIVGMRNRLIHAYFDVTVDVVWDTIEQDLPERTRELTRILEQAGRP